MRLVWKVSIAYKFKAFAWRGLINRLSTKNLLLLEVFFLHFRIFIVFFCKDREESLDHVLFSCDIVKEV